MRFQHVFVRGIRPAAVPDAEVSSLTQLLLEQPTELQLTSRGAKRGDEPLQFAQASAALARRNIRSLLALDTSLAQATDAIRRALTEVPEDAEAALADAGLEFNLRDSLYATVDATVSLQNHELVITDGTRTTHRLIRTELREEGKPYFCADGLARLTSLPIEAVRFSPSAVLPLSTQREAGALMQPDTAQQRLQKGDWRSTRKLDFVKEFCITCSKCFIHCPDNAIMHAMFDKTSKNTTGILGIDFERCTACGICVSVCPTDRSGNKSLVMIDIHAESSREAHHVG